MYRPKLAPERDGLGIILTAACTLQVSRASLQVEIRDGWIGLGSD